MLERGLSQDHSKMSVSAIAGELETEQDEDEFKPGHIKTAAKYYKTDGSSVDNGPFF